MHVAEEPAVVHVAHDVLDGVEREIDLGRVVHREHDAGHDLDRQHHHEDRAEGPPVVQVARGRVVESLPIDEGHDGQPLMKPPAESALGLICRMPGHGLSSQPMRILVSDMYSYLGMYKFCGAGPPRIRPAVSYCERWQGQNQPPYCPASPIGTQPKCVHTPSCGRDCSLPLTTGFSAVARALSLRLAL